LREFFEEFRGSFGNVFMLGLFGVFMVFDVVVSWLVGVVGFLGYGGIFLLMFLESTFFPFPSEVVIVPAGYLAFLGELNLGLVILMGVLGSLCGAWLNYFIADRFGRRVLLRFLRECHLVRVEDFFRRHGHVSMFNGRLIPVVRQYISFPAGLARMNGWRFSLYTGLGSFVWVSILALVGYFLGANEELISFYLGRLTFVVLGFVVLVCVVYVWWRGRERI
jgi:membrane protein DedA with SNARE-associated domain